MKLTYRGVDYDYNPPMLEVSESDIAVQYRGHAARYTYVRHVPIPQSAERLTYRGATYQTTRQGQVQQLTGSGQPATPVTTPAINRGAALSTLRNKLMGVSPAAQARRELLHNSSLMHKENIARALQHRMEVAKAQGNDVLVRQLESEMRQSV
ncbi:MAG: DUF4278 domain-containing protein [Phormidesmis sp.]